MQNIFQINSFGASNPCVDMDKFGASVAYAVNGSRAFVGAMGFNSDQGRVYEFAYNQTMRTWNQIDTFIPSDIIIGDCFGMAVAPSYDGTKLLVSASNTNHGKGTVYYFKRPDINSPWKQVGTVVPTSPVSSDGDQFGIAMSLSADGSQALISSTHENLYGNDRGAVYYFVCCDDIWIQKDIIGSPNPSSDRDEFGSGVSLSANGSMALIGAQYQSSLGKNRGLVYFYTKENDTWGQVSCFGSSKIGSDGDSFGCSVALSADASHAVVGAYEYPLGGKYRGIAYYFSRRGMQWQPMGTFYACKPLSSDGDEFSVSSAITPKGDRALVGAHFCADGGKGRGLVYEFRLPQPYYHKSLWDSFWNWLTS